MERRRSHRPRVGRNAPERRKLLFDRRRHAGLFRIFFIPWRRLFFEFSDVKVF